MLVACALVVTVFACQREQKVYLGYVAGLRGLGSELGQAGFNGAVLAVENINHQGGIDGRQVELLVRDHLGDTDLAIEEVHELVEAGCVAFIGQMLSQKSVKVLPALQGSGIVMVSPTTATSELSEKDDQFLRIYPDERLFASRLARYASREQGLRHMVVVANSDNRSFSEPWIRNFSDFYIGAGGVSVERIWFSNGSGGTFAAAAVETLKGHPDGVVILANARDSGMLAQHIRRHDRDIALFTAEWSFAGDLLRYGG
ncbi:MAG: amino acid ABC transporter substrate-binding protein, partial [Desulfuromonas sp.]